MLQNFWSFAHVKRLQWCQMAHSTGENKTCLATFVDNGIHLWLFTLSFFVDNVDESLQPYEATVQITHLLVWHVGITCTEVIHVSRPEEKVVGQMLFSVALKFRIHAVLKKRLVCGCGRMCVCTCSSLCRARPPLSTCAVVLSYDIMHRRQTWWHSRGRVTLCSRSRCEHTAVLILCGQWKNGVSISRNCQGKKTVTFLLFN